MRKIIGIAVAGVLWAGGVFAVMNYVSASGQENYYNGGAAISAGDVIDLNTRYGVSLGDIASNATGVVKTEGIFEFTLQSNQVVTVGHKMYWDSSTSLIMTNITAANFIGLSIGSKATSATTQRSQVDLNAQPRP